MNQPNPLEPHSSSMLERAAQSRSRLKLAVFTSIGISVVGLTAMLIGGQGCKREEPTPPPAPTETIPPPSFDPGTNSSTTQPAPTSTMGGTTPTDPAVMPSNSVPDYSVPPPAVTTTTAPPPVTTTIAPPPAPTGEPTAREYVIQKGDTFATIAKKEGLGTKAIEKANPGVDPRRLKINQKIVLPAPTPRTETAPTAAPAPAGGEGSYVVKSGDTLSKIAKNHHVSLAALRKANSLTTDRIKVNQKLVIPAKPPGTTPAETAPASGTAPAVPPATSGGGIPPA